MGNNIASTSVFALVFCVFSAIAPVSAQFAHAAMMPAISIFPARVMQGEPFKIAVEQVAVIHVKSISFAGKNLDTFLYQGKPSAFAPADLSQKAGTYLVAVTLTDGRVLEKNIVVSARPKVEAPLGIPEKLGGNTPTSATALVTTLADENRQLVGITTAPSVLWSGTFAFPLAKITVTDSYGYSRQTSGYTIAHKGTDFRAAESTSVAAMNRGIVRLAKNFRNYGNTIVVDHGLGLMTFYMHLSKINVKIGDTVERGQVIGLSGQTGYAEQPHLHVTVRINDISIDPMKFMLLF